MDEEDEFDVGRRRFLSAGAVSAGAAATLTVAPAAAQQSAPFADGRPSTREVTLNVNGRKHAVNVDTRMTLLDTLREKLQLTGSKKGCDQGQCGACTIHMDGERRLSCLTLAVAAEGFEIVTIEGLADGDDLHPMQAAFVDNDAFQCGYCTPGQIMSAIACVREGHARTDHEIREYMSGNLCRCAAYPNIVAAINQAKPKMGRS